MDNNIKPTYTTPRISNLINQTNEDQDALTNTPSITYDTFYYNNNITNNNHNNEKTDSSMVSVQGDDPPQRLMRMSSRNRSLKEIYPHSSSQEKIASPPYSPATSSSSSIASYDSDTQQPTFVQEYSPDTTTAKTGNQSPFSCLVVFDALENTASSIRRGRPPVTEEYNPDSQLRFVKPTICSVHMSKRKKPEPQNKSGSETNTFMASYDDGDMSAGFDSPNKKRGRRPKSQIQGNSFFVLKNPKLPSR
jgi:hypothetical protein